MRFVLVHGGFHGAWCWSRTIPQLERLGHEAIAVPRFWEADLPRSYILCLEDRSKPRWLSDVVANRLGVEQLTIDASHSPFLSQPAALAEVLVHATTTKPIGPL